MNGGGRRTRKQLIGYAPARAVIARIHGKGFDQAAALIVCTQRYVSYGSAVTSLRERYVMKSFKLESVKLLRVGLEHALRYH